MYGQLDDDNNGRTKLSNGMEKEQVRYSEDDENRERNEGARQKRIDRASLTSNRPDKNHRSDHPHGHFSQSVRHAFGFPYSRSIAIANNRNVKLKMIRNFIEENEAQSGAQILKCVGDLPEVRLRWRRSRKTKVEFVSF